MIPTLSPYILSPISGPVGEDSAIEAAAAARMRSEDLVQLGEFALRAGDRLAASEYFNAAAPDDLQAARGLAALRGECNALYLDALAGQFLDQALDPAGLGAMALASTTFQFTRTLLGSRFLRWGMGRAAAPAAFTAAFAAEAASFPLHHRLLDFSLGFSVSWEGERLEMEIGASFLTLGALRLFGSGATRLYRGLGAAPRWEGLFHQSGMALGILSSRGFENALGYSDPEGSPGAWWLQAGVTWLHFNVAGRALGSLAAPRTMVLPPGPRRSLGPRYLEAAWAEASIGRQGIALESAAEPASRLLHFSLGRGRGFFEWSESEQYEAIAQALEAAQGEIRAAADHLGIAEKSLRKRLARAERDRPEVLGHWLERLSSQGRRSQRDAMWREMAELLTTHQGVMKAAAQEMGVSESTFHYRLSQARQKAPEDHPIRSWTERLSPRGRQRSRMAQFKKIARALEQHDGNILGAARSLEVSPTVIYNALDHTARHREMDSPLKVWVERFTEAGQRRARRRRWMDYIRALIDASGDIKTASKNLGITQGTYARYLQEITALDGTEPIDPYYRRILLSTLSWTRPTDRRLLNMILNGENETNRLVAIQSLASEARVVQGTLRQVLSEKPSPLVRIAAEHSLGLSREERVLWLLGLASRTLTYPQILRGTGMLSRQLTSILHRYQESGLLVFNGGQRYGLTPEGRQAFQTQRDPLRWDWVDQALEQTQGHRRQAAALLGISHETFNKQLQAALGRNGNHGNPAPQGHPLHRWGDELYQERIRRRKSRATGFERYLARWQSIEAALQVHGGDFGLAAGQLQISETRLAHLIRLARAYDYQPLARFADPEMWRSYRAQKQEMLWNALREQNRQWYHTHSRYRSLSLRKLPLADPIHQTSQHLRVELVLRYQMGERRAGDLLLQIYERWIRAHSRRKARDGVSRDELMQAGREGLLEAAERFDPSRGNRFSTYAQYYILKNQITLLNTYLSTDVSRSDYQLFHQLQELRWAAAGRGETLSHEQAMEILGVDSGKFQEILQLGDRVFARSLDQRRGEGEGYTLHDQVVGARSDGFQGRLADRFRRVLHEFFLEQKRRGNSLWTPKMLMAEREEIVDLALSAGMTPKQYLRSRNQMRVALQAFLESRGIDAGFFE